jgi:hypothetical protein
MQENEHNEEAYLKEMAPTLFGAKHQIPSDAPEGYFDALPGRLLQRIGDEKELKRKGRIVRMVSFRNISIAAGLALILAVVPFIREYVGGDDSGSEKAFAEMQLDYSDEATIEAINELVEYDAIYASIDVDEIELWELGENIDDKDIADYLTEEGLREEIYLETNF